MGCSQIICKLVWRCHQLSEFLAKENLPRVLRQSCLSANDKGDNEMKLGAVHRSGIYLTAEENPGKPQLGRRQSAKAMLIIIVSNGVPYLQM